MTPKDVLNLKKLIKLYESRERRVRSGIAIVEDEKREKIKLAAQAEQQVDNMRSSLAELVSELRGPKKVFTRQQYEADLERIAIARLKVDELIVARNDANIAVIRCDERIEAIKLEANTIRKKIMKFETLMETVCLTQD